MFQRWNGSLIWFWNDGSIPVKGQSDENFLVQGFLRFFLGVSSTWESIRSSGIFNCDNLLVWFWLVQEHWLERQMIGERCVFSEEPLLGIQFFNCPFNILFDF
jgi:hypothetical protein